MIRNAFAGQPQGINLLPDGESFGHGKNSRTKRDTGQFERDLDATMRCEVIKFPTSKGRAIMFGDNPLLDDSPRPRGPTSLILISPMAESVKLR